MNNISVDSRVLYFKHLDVLRFFAFFLVFWQHGFANSFMHLGWDKATYYAFALTGGMGVQIFFVLSGFLITYLLIQEHQSCGEISIGAFYLRRIFRIWPVYYLVMFLGIWVLPNLFSAFEFCGSYWKNLLFLNNFDKGADCNSPQVKIAWSVAIEEQFYLIWPLIFAALYRTRALLIAAIALLFAGGACFIYLNQNDYYFHSLGNIHYLMTGCAVAFLFPQVKTALSQMKLVRMLILFSAVTIVVISRLYFDWWWSVLLPVLYAGVIITLAATPNTVRSIPGLHILGKYTYGMYMYHPAILVFTKMLFDKMGWAYKNSGSVNMVMAILALIATVVISYISYVYFEKYFLRRKAQFSKVKTRS